MLQQYYMAVGSSDGHAPRCIDWFSSTPVVYRLRTSREISMEPRYDR